MKTVAQKIKKLAKQVRGLFPSNLPVGVEAFNSWALELSETYDLPTKDLDSVKFTLASIIMHSGPKDDKKSNIHFVRTMRAAAAKQIAGHVFYEIKTQQQEAAAKAAAESSAASH